VNERLLPVLEARPSDIAARVLVVGDPARGEAAAARLEGVRRVGANREFVTWTGGRSGQRVTVASHGIGSAGAGICFEELLRAGARTVVRAGTCGAVGEGIADGDLVIATGAVRGEGLTPRLVPLGFPAVADPDSVLALRAAASERGVEAHQGIVLTSDLFYPSRGLGPDDWDLWRASGVVAVEMELAALFVLASLRRARAGGILAVDGDPTASEDMSGYEPRRDVVQQGVERMIDIALDALAGLP